MKGEAIARDGVAAALSSCRISDILPARATTLYREFLCKIFPSFYSDQCTGPEAREFRWTPLASATLPDNEPLLLRLCSLGIAESESSET